MTGLDKTSPNSLDYKVVDAHARCSSWRHFSAILTLIGCEYLDSHTVYPVYSPICARPWLVDRPVTVIRSVSFVALPADRLYRTTDLRNADLVIDSLDVLKTCVVSYPTMHYFGFLKFWNSQSNSVDVCV